LAQFLSIFIAVLRLFCHEQSLRPLIDGFV
jgi:hypothetical protein